MRINTCFYIYLARFFVSMFSSRGKIVNTHTLHVRLPLINRKSSERKHRANIKRVKTWINVNFSIILFLFTSMYSSWRTRWDGKSFFPLNFWWTSKLSLAIASFFSYLFFFFLTFKSFSQFLVLLPLRIPFFLLLTFPNFYSPSLDVSYLLGSFGQSFPPLWYTKECMLEASLLLTITLLRWLI